MTSTYEKIATNTLTSNQANVTFSTISGSYTDLVIAWNAGNSNGTTEDLLFQYNNDTGSNYSVTQLYGNGSTATSARYTGTSFISGNYPLASTIISMGLINIQNYSNTTTYKTSLTRTGSGSSFVFSCVGTWRNTAAITAIKIFSSTGNLLSGSTFTLYGIKAE
jgi:hypothetical protein